MIENVKLRDRESKMVLFWRLFNLKVAECVMRTISQRVKLHR